MTTHGTMGPVALKTLNSCASPSRPLVNRTLPSHANLFSSASRS
eukprot:CAMPEP_0184683298 /NCGR_PEP_ID=MMETSP0312-20130426/10678_1 /TAXON_ID=31354 /ORGANISM="Compsopogon coeruleus, Strain SAG 36.94" /LENGTH=43 /DNA_ID= /DNA_START= /DNA_END= /DNA_ORIENTATION=